MRVVAVVQARMGSTRLPGKVMKDLLGKPVLTRDVNRIRRAKRIDEIVIATTTRQEDDLIASLCEEEGWYCFRGSENDVSLIGITSSSAFTTSSDSKFIVISPLSNNEASSSSVFISP